VFLYPWAVVFDRSGLYACHRDESIFMVILLVGYIYAWRKRRPFVWD